MHEWFPMAVHLLEGLFFGYKNTQQAIGQRERLLALGSLSAGLTHELNNPAAAAVRATASLRERVAGMRHKLGMIAGGAGTGTTLETLIAAAGRGGRAGAEGARRWRRSRPPTGRTPSRDWLDDHGVRRRLGSGARLRRGRARRGVARSRRRWRSDAARSWRARCGG